MAGPAALVPFETIVGPNENSDHGDPITGLVPNTTEKRVPDANEALQPPLQGPRRSNSKHAPHDRPEVACSGMDHVSLLDVLDAAQPSSARASRSAGVSKTPLDSFTS